jgi:hypothetical protein
VTSRRAPRSRSLSVRPWRPGAQTSSPPASTSPSSACERGKGRRS